MLKLLGAMRRPLVPALAVVALSLTFVTVNSFQEAAADGGTCWDPKTGQLSYGCSDEDPGGDDSDGGDSGGGDGGGSTEPSCDTSKVESSPHHWCEGQNACWANIPSAAYPTPDTWPSEPPTPGAVYIFKNCYGPNGDTVYSDWGWYTPDQPSREELAREAYGELQAPDYRLAFSPPRETVIFLDTWWWAEGADPGNLIGSAALGVRAIAEPDHMEVDPGDGSGMITCEVVTEESDACTYMYERASDGDGYPARARLIYNVHFEQNGEQFDVSGLPDTFETPWTEATVPVAEVQTSVVR